MTDWAAEAAKFGGTVDAPTDWAAEGKKLGGKVVAPPATMEDRAQAGAAGFNRGALTGIPGLPVDTLLNVLDLAKAGIGTVGKATGLMSTEQMPQMTERAGIPLSSEWIAQKMRDAGAGKVIDPNMPTDTASRVLGAFGQGAAGAMLGGPKAIAPNMAMGGTSQAAAQGAQELGAGPEGQVLASLIPGAAPALRAAIPNQPGRAMTPREQILTDAQAKGYVFPPSLMEESSPSIVNNALEKLSGKVATAQGASVKNRNLTQELIAPELGLQPGQPITREALANVRSQAGQAYEAVKQTGVVTTGKPYDAALDAIVAPYKTAAGGFPNAKPNPIIEQVESLRTPAFDASAGVAKIAELRAQADTAYAGGDKVTGKALRSAAGAIEDALDQHLQNINAPDLLTNYRGARRLIAKTYTAENAMNPATGEIDASKLIPALRKGKLDGEMQTAAQVAAAARKAMSPAQGAAGISKLDALTSTGSVLGAIFSHNPYLALGALAPIAASTARGAMLSGPYQRTMVKPNLGGSGLLSDMARGLLPQDQMGLLGALDIGR